MLVEVTVPVYMQESGKLFSRSHHWVDQVAEQVGGWSGRKSHYPNNGHAAAVSLHLVCEDRLISPAPELFVVDSSWGQF